MPVPPDQALPETTERELVPLFSQLVQMLQQWGEEECRQRHAYRQARIVMNGSDREIWVSTLVRTTRGELPQTLRIYHPSGFPEGVRVDVGVNGGSFTFSPVGRWGDTSKIDVNADMKGKIEGILRRLMFEDIFDLRMESRRSSREEWMPLDGFQEITLGAPLLETVKSFINRSTGAAMTS